MRNDTDPGLQLEMIQAILNGDAVAYNIKVDKKLGVGRRGGSGAFYMVNCDIDLTDKKERKHAGKGHRKVKQD